MHLTLRRALCSATASVVLVTLAGCGGDDTSTAKSSSTPATSPAASATTSSSASSPGSASQDATPTGSAVAATGEPVSGEEFAGVLKDALSKATTARISMDLGSGGSARGEADYA